MKATLGFVVLLVGCAMTLACGDDTEPTSTGGSGGAGGMASGGGGTGGGAATASACFARCASGNVCVTVDDPSTCDAEIDTLCSDVMDVDVRGGCSCPGEPGECSELPDWY